MRRLALIIGLAAVALGGCSLLFSSSDCGEFCPWPDPPLTSPMPDGMAEAVAVATPYATELSQTPAELRTAFPLNLEDWCDQDLCPGSSGPGWGVVFEITDPDHLPSQVLVVLDLSPEMLFTQQ